MTIQHLSRAATLAACLVIVSQTADAASAGNGEKLFKTKCATCHDTNANKHKVGPSVRGVVGREAGHADGFKFYRGLKSADWTWDEATLDAYLADPVAYTKGKTGQNSGMVFKLPNPQERADVIAFLKTLK